VFVIARCYSKRAENLNLMNDFAGRVAIVTGTTGIGRAIALRFAAGGAQVVACGIETGGNQDLAEESTRRGLTVQVESCDVTDIDQVRSVIGKTVILHGGLHVIVNAAAIHPFGNIVQTDPGTWSRCMMVNVGSIYLLAHLGIPEMIKSGGGSIINLSSVQGHACQRGVAAYAASKGAVHSLTRALALDHAADNIRVNSISPGSIRTAMLARSAGNFSPDLPVEEVFQRFGASHPLGRIGTPEEVAELAAFLASDKAAFCTGGDYLVDGGLLAGIGVQ
jgi:meso-butanediol dehydrogenase / (S,S)-butanediol dehydrogenase / diacetyl reductase